jgi:nitrate/nitrite transporter NarK
MEPKTVLFFVRDLGNGRHFAYIDELECVRVGVVSFVAGELWGWGVVGGVEL